MPLQQLCELIWHEPFEPFSMAMVGQTFLLLWQTVAVFFHLNTIYISSALGTNMMYVCMKDMFPSTILMVQDTQKQKTERFYYQQNLPPEFTS